MCYTFLVATWTQHETWYGKVRVDPYENYVCIFGNPMDHISTHGCVEYRYNTNMLVINDGNVHVNNWEYFHAPWVLV